MNFLGVDVGGATRNGIAIVDNYERLLFYEEIPFDKHGTKGDHRRKVARRVRDLVMEYNVEYVGVEHVRLFRAGAVSKLTNIDSLTRIVCTITDAVHTLCPIYDFEVRSWKAAILKNANATKEDSIRYVKNTYNIDVCHDVADSICIAKYMSRNFAKIEPKHNITDK